MRTFSALASSFLLAFALLGCSRESSSPDMQAKAGLPPEPVGNHAPSAAQPGEKIDHGELIMPVHHAKKQLHAQHHPHGGLETRRVPGPFATPAITEIKDFALSKDDLDVI